MKFSVKILLTAFSETAIVLCVPRNEVLTHTGKGMTMKAVQATITRIEEDGRVVCRVRRATYESTLYLMKTGKTPNDFHLGQKVMVVRRTNNPFLFLA